MFNFEDYLKKTPREEELQKELDALFDEEEKLIKEAGIPQKREEIFAKMREERAKKREKREKMVADKELERGMTCDEVVERLKKLTGNKEREEESEESEELKIAIYAISKLSKEDYGRLIRMICDDDTGAMDKVTVHSRKLVDFFVQFCIDYCKQNGLNDVDTIYFSVDGLEPSIKYGEWVPASDASLSIYRYKRNKDGKITYKRELTDFIC